MAQSFNENDDITQVCGGVGDIVLLDDPIVININVVLVRLLQIKQLVVQDYDLAETTGRKIFLGGTLGSVVNPDTKTGPVENKETRKECMEELFMSITVNVCKPCQESRNT